MSRHKWEEKNHKRYMDIPFGVSSEVRMRPWNEAHAYWIEKHRSIKCNPRMIGSEEATKVQTAEELRALELLNLFEASEMITD